MDDNTVAALNQGGIADIITIGRKSGQPRRTEIYFHQLDDKFYVSGTAEPRDWVANLNADPHFVLHLKRCLSANVSATARHVTKIAERRRIIRRILTAGSEQDADTITPEMDDVATNGLLIEFTVT